MSIQQKKSFVKPKGNKFRFIVLFCGEKYGKQLFLSRAFE